MKIPVALVVVLGLCVVLVAAKKPGGGRGGHGGKKGTKPGHGNPPPMTPDATDAGGRGPGRKPSKGGRNPSRGGGHHGRPDQTEGTDPACETLDCQKPTRDTAVCGTDGETYRSECLLVRDRCKGRIAADVEVASQGRCQHPAEAGEPQGHRGPGRTKPGHGKRPGGKTRGGRRPPAKGRWPKECWGLVTTMAPTTDIDHITDIVPEGPVCTASCPASTAELPLQSVCGTNGRTYESECVLELVACVTNNQDLMVSSEGACQ